MGIPNEEQVDILKCIEYKLLHTIKLKGVESVKKVFMKKDRRKYISDEGNINFKEEWMLETDGSNLKEIMVLDLIDFKRTYSNSCMEMQDRIGIEGARQSIIKEIKMILDVYGIYIN